MKQQYQIVKKKVLTPEISQISVHAPLVAAKAKVSLSFCGWTRMESAFR